MKPITRNPRYFVGYRAGEYTIIRERRIPTEASHGARFDFCLGPYTRKAEAEAAINVQGRGWR